MKQYKVNEIFYSLQGEGRRAGTANLFLRLSGCNVQCAKEAGPRSIGGFDCDTEFVSGVMMTAEEILARFAHLTECKAVIVTGGEPALQLDDELISALKGAGFFIAVETNGSLALPEGLDWITVSPKVAEHAIRQTTANEVKYVRGYGQGIPMTSVKADHYLISPAFAGQEADPEAMAWCIDLVRKNPKWALSIQQHKLWSIR